MRSDPSRQERSDQDPSGKDPSGKDPSEHDPSERALGVLRQIWHAQGQDEADLAEACGTTKSCKNMRGVGFDGLAAAGEPTAGQAASASAPTTGTAGDEVGSDMRAAWRSTLERDGKRDPNAGTVADLVFGSNSPSA